MTFPFRILFAFLAVPCLAAALPWADGSATVTGRVVDENGNAVAAAHIAISGGGMVSPMTAVSDDAGRFSITALDAGAYELRVQKVGYYSHVDPQFQVSGFMAPLEIVIRHPREYEETVQVTYSPPAVDPGVISAQTSLTAEEITDLPFSSTHDFRNALPLIPAVIKDNAGRVHLNGGGENQAYYSLDGFNITSPVSSILENRISVDAIRTVRVETSRFSAENGKGSAGVMALEIARGDNQHRFSATNFMPSFEFHDGLTLSNWTPRASVSGPILKDRFWYFNAMDLQYDLNIVDQLPPTANTNRNWSGSDMTLLQFNLTERNILTGSFLVNFRSSRHMGITPLDPVETSRNRTERFYFASVKNQVYFQGGWGLETGAAINHMYTNENPLGTGTYVIAPSGRSGNYFQHQSGTAERVQLLANLVTPSWDLAGKHYLKFGVDANRLRYQQLSHRRAYEVRRRDGTRSRLVEFAGDPSFGKESAEFSAYAQDRWNPSERVLVETGLRMDWDQIVREPLLSPRFALTWSPRSVRESKFSAGAGLFRDAVSLALLGRSMDQRRNDVFFAADGTSILNGPVQSRFVSEENGLRPPYSFNWSVGWEQRLPASFYMRSDLIRRHGRRGWSYYSQSSPGSAGRVNTFRLDAARRDSYSYLELTLTRRFKEKYPWLLSYVRSKARSTAVIDVSVENPLFGAEGNGALDWDAPNRMISWGVLPAPWFRPWTIAYFVEWHSGFPYSTTNEFQELVGSPNRMRFPDYFSLNLHVERRFKLFRHLWALRGGFNNLTGRHNPTVVQNMLGTPEFGTFMGGQGRAFTGRIRFLGKKP